MQCRESESSTPDTGRRRSGCPQVGCLWSGRRTGVGIVATVRPASGRAAVHSRPGCGQAWAPPRSAAGRSAGTATTRETHDKATRHPAQVSWMPRPRRSVSKSGKHTAQRRAVTNDDSGRKREALDSPLTVSINVGRLPQAPACGGLGAGREPDPPPRLLSTSAPSPEARRWTRRPRRHGRGVRYRGRRRP